MAVGSAAIVAPVASDRAHPRHPAIVRVTHWAFALCFFALLLSGVEILISHPRFYWGETGTVMTPALFQIPIPSSRATVQTGYSYVLPDQNGWSRYLHFEAAWGAVFVGAIYFGFGLMGHFWREFIPPRRDLKWSALTKVISKHMQRKSRTGAGERSYNVLQRLTYVLVVFVLFPLVVWTGLAMSPAIGSVWPATVSMLGGQQSARTIHFFVSLMLVLFLLIHVGMVWRYGFRNRVRLMISGR